MKTKQFTRAQWSGLLAAGIVVSVAFAAVCAALGTTAWIGVIGVLLAGAVLGYMRKLEVDLHHAYKRLESWHALYSVVEFHTLPPAPRAWAASPELLRTVVELVTCERPRVVIELGSGSSTVWIASALAQCEAGEIISLDHDAKFAGATEHRLAQHRLTNARVVFAPLVPTKVADKTIHWYETRELESLAPGSVDLLVVDGPPGREQPLARLPALPCFERLLSERAVVILDDADRADERLITQMWCAHGDGWDAEMRETEKGVTIFRRRNAKKN